MKKLYLMLLSFCTLILFGCGNEELNNNLMISVYYEGSNDSDCAIQIYNNSEEEVSLKGYTINIYPRYETEAKVKIKLGNERLQSKKVFVVSNPNANETIINKADLISEELLFKGTESISLAYKNQNIDVMGSIGYEFVGGKNVTYVRKVNELIPNKTFDSYSYIEYGCDNTNYFGSFTNSVTPEELLEGPMLDDIYIDNPNYPFFNPTSDYRLGGGGATKVTLYKNVDGDTAYFFFDEFDINLTRISEGNVIKVGGKTAGKVRYQDIDTPESYVGNIQEFGLYAKANVSKMQNEAKQIYVQSIKDGGVLCTYGRIMGYVFVDKVMVNYYVIKNGLSTVAFDSQINCCMYYKDIPYTSYFKNAKEYAKRNKLGLYGEKDPYWDYDKGQVKSEYMYGI